MRRRTSESQLKCSAMRRAPTSPSRAARNAGRRREHAVSPVSARLAAVAVTLALTMLWPFANQLFAFGPLHADDLALTFGAGVIALVVLELLKPLLHPRLPQTRPGNPLAMDQTPKPTER